MSNPRVTGIGGVFFKVRDKEAMVAFYRDLLGVDVQSWGGAVFRWAPADSAEEAGTTTWSLFDADSDYFGPADNAFMVNYRVDDLDAMLAHLRAEGVEVLDKVEESEYGRFGWCHDPEGNRIELWEPPEGM